MKNRIFLALFLFITSIVLAQNLGAQEFETVFNKFLTKFTERHEQLKTITIPDVEILTTPDREGDALYMLYFNNAENSKIFNEAVQKENIRLFIFNENETQIGLVYSDIALFLMKIAIGL